jgi:hypothetical protein
VVRRGPGQPRGQLRRRPGAGPHPGRAELAARQWLIDRLHLLGEGAGDERRAGMEDEAEYACLVFAAVYSDHPDYRAEWRP